ncbi:hypothetical protein [Thiomonas sp.]
MTASGWDLNLISETEAVQDSIFAYLYDHHCSQLTLLQVPAPVFQKLLRQGAQLSRRKKEQVCTALITRIHQGLETGDSSELAALFSLYWGGTETAKITKAEVPHRFVVHYPLPERAGLLRPFAMDDPSGSRFPLPANRALEVVHQVRIQDSARHPEWFPGG